jgi:sigma-B regulation protein RsbU (phosphoserine phosphatase)
MRSKLLSDVIASQPVDAGFVDDLQDLYENAPCAYLSLRPDARIARANATLAAWTGFDRSELIGRPFHDLLTVPSRIFVETHFAPLLRLQGFFDELAIDLVRKDGGRLTAIASASERRDADGALLFTRVSLFKATERRRYERDLASARASAESQKEQLEESLKEERATAELREQFIAVLGHDLRNPLAALGAGTSMLARLPLDPKSAAIVPLMQASVTRMTALVENIMDFARSRLGSGIALNRAPDDIEPLLRQVTAELRLLHPDAKIEETFSLPRSLDVDAAALSRLFGNLLANALTHGAKEMPVRVAGMVDSGVFELSVANSGTPIPPEAMHRLFQPYARGDAPSGTRGLGLGLYIADQIARAHGGTLSATSTSQETRFAFRMPVR